MNGAPRTRSTPGPAWRALALVLTLCVGATAGAAGDQPAPGKFLVAARDMPSEVFGETVILLLDYGPETGAIGVIVNHPSDVKIADVLPDLPGADRYRGTVYFGGPVELDALVALTRTGKPPETARPVFGRVYVVSPAIALAPRRAADATSLRFYAGYAGWAPGQLEDEIARGDWTLRPASEDAVFAKDAATLWRTLAPPRQLQLVRR